MGSETMDLEQLASFLGRDARELGKLAHRGLLPGRKVGGEWHFAKAEIHHWLECAMPGLTEKELNALDPACPISGYSPLISSLLPVDCIDLQFNARTRGSVLRGLVKLAERSHRVWDPEAILKAIEAREANASTAQPEGYAVPHPHRRLENTLGESVVALGRTSSGIPFGAASGGLTDVYFLVCCTDDTMHLRTLARIARLLRQPGFLDALRDTVTPVEAWGLIDGTERGLTN